MKINKEDVVYTVEGYIHSLINQEGKRIHVKDLLEWKGTDSEYTGRIVCFFEKLGTGAIRCIAQDDRGLLLIKNPDKGVLLSD